jgi:hypothetical protein
MATQDKKVPVQTGGKNGGKNGGGGKTNEDMLKMGRNEAKVANQKRSK